MLSWKERDRTDFIILHNSGDSIPQDGGVDDLYRRDTKVGHIDVGHHFVISRTGGVEEGRPLHAPGSHTPGYDHNSVSVCLVGSEPTEAQYRSLLPLLEDELLHHYGDAQIVGAYQLRDNETGPGFDVPAWLESLSLEEHSYDNR
jgi:hypothetical protein